MYERVIRIRMLVFLLLLGLCVWVWVIPYFGHASGVETFTVSFLDVGQGDAILIETPDGIDVLVDGGRNDAVLQELTAVLGAFDRTIDMVVATHPDADHIGGLSGVLDRYQVATVLMTENESDSASFESFLSRVESEDATLIYARAGQMFQLGASTTLRVLFPTTDASDMESNASSIVVKISYGATDVLLTGDAPERIEDYLVGADADILRSEILKAGHHGSRTSSGDSFIGAVQPAYTVISAGKDNQYGHPHQEVIERIHSYGSTLYSTQRGRITFTSDGTAITAP